MKYDLPSLAKKAHDLLNNIDSGDKSEYLMNKNIIRKLFDGENTFENIYTRLLILDSTYSTQVGSKRLFGIREIADALIKKQDSEWKKDCKEFVNCPIESEFFKLITKEYGYNKKGFNSGHALSLLSKYFFYLTECNFPIKDRLVEEVYPIILEKQELFGIENLKQMDKNKLSFFECIIELKNKSTIETFDQLDTLLWTVGKICFGSFQYLMSKEQYLNLKIKENIEWNRVDNVDTDQAIRNYISKNINRVENQHLKELIIFSKELCQERFESN